MRKIVSRVITALVLTSLCIITWGQNKSGSISRYSANVITGYNHGFGLEGNFVLHNFVQDFPFAVKIGIGFAGYNPGNGYDARRMFIDNNIDGTLTKTGQSFNLSLDFMLLRKIFGLDSSYLAFGPRFSNFLGDFRYIDNEILAVSSHQWGLGAAIIHRFPMYRKIDLVFTYGFDYYFPSKISGHGTSYSPDNDNLNPQLDILSGVNLFRYHDVDKAINQPRFMPRLMLGFMFDF